MLKIKIPLHSSQLGVIFIENEKYYMLQQMKLIFNYTDEINMQFAENVETSYSFRPGILISHDGQEYPQLPFKCEEHAELDYALKDPLQTEILYSAYEQYVEGTLTASERSLFLKALVKTCYLFGSAERLPGEAFYSALAYEGFNVADWQTSYPSALSQFIHTANNSSVQPPSKKQGRDRQNVVIITTTASGGNFSVATAMKAHLETFGNRFKVTIVDSEAIAEKHDPFKKATGLLTIDGIYYRIIQQANEFDRGFRLRDEHKKVARYIQSTELYEMKKEVASHHPDIILTTRNFIPDDLTLSSLGVPLRVVYCDYEIGLFLFDIVGRIHPLVRFWLPAIKPRIFRFFLTTRLGENAYREGQTMQETYQAVGKIAKTSSTILNKQYKVFGFPLREEIYLIDNKQDIETLRQKWGLHTGERCVPVVMGINGVGILEKIFNQLLDSPKGNLPIKFIFVCGRNQLLKDKLENRLLQAECQNSALARSTIHGLASSTEINELLNLATIQIAKPGGSTVGDVLKVGTPLFIIGQLPWEVVNGDELRDYQLAYYEQENGPPLLSQVESAILDFEMRGGGKKAASDLTDWKTNLIQFLEE